MAKTKEEASKTKVILKGVRFSYANVFRPTAIEGSDNAKYNVSLLIKKNHPQLAEIKKKIELAIAGGHPKWKSKRPANLKLPLRDGDKERPDNPEYKGMYFLGANSHIKPKIVSTETEEVDGKEQLVQITDPEEFYSGCYGNASINFYTYGAAGNNGVACGLNNLQKTKDGERLASGSTADEDFAGESVEVDDL